MNKFIKVQFIKSGVPTGNPYTYKTDLDVAIGDEVMISEKCKGVVVGFETIDNITDPNRIKAIFGKVEKESD